VICYTSTKVPRWEKDSESFASQTGLPFNIRDVETQEAKNFCENLAKKFSYDLAHKIPKTAVF
jgi:hypothetical protein